MRMIKFVAALIVILALVGIGLYAANNSDSLPISQDRIPDQVKNFRISQESFSQLGKLSEHIPEDTPVPPVVNQTLAGIYENAQHFSSDASQVLGAAIQATDSGKPLHEQAFEYGRYLYCQQIVESWDNKTK